MRKVYLLFIGLFLAGCSAHPAEETYQGRDLTIGVIGSVPSIKEKNVVFEQITLDEMEKRQHLDAILIMKESLTEADQEQYVAVYRNLTIPVFFMQSTKAHVPFTNDGVDYASFPDVDASSYATGFLSTAADEGFNERTWRYHLKDDQESKSNIEIVYNQIFNTIESVNSK
ncbi:hypothetical protein MHZ95_15785 [Sporosarcina sp. ACRSM]|uniref:hypothetical protein n=1 Tax=Sporosarcina sp. ACRSM TaxID=2918216 RepID=UPI001EF53BC9|nr:hypothetical protein [Sporosarcina sp. ACRSM]MCG7336728.1 hypothetical protein [Sporosarcina sp. ACRSM]